MTLLLDRSSPSVPVGPDIDDDVTRREFIVGGAVAGLLVAAGCGSSDEDDRSASPASSTAGDGTYPVTIEHRFGETVIGQPSERVVSLGYTEQDAILVFGVVPVAARYAFGPEDDVFFPWADGAAGDARPEILPRAEVNVEQVAALQPDLIMAITAGLTEEQYGQLSNIAPVVVQPAEYPDFGTPWQDQTLVTGRVFGQEAKARALVAEVEALFDKARADHPVLAGRTLALSGPTFNGEYPFHASADTRSRFFVALGMKVPGELDDIAGDAFFGTVSQERAELLDRDVVVFQAGSPEERAAIEADPILGGLAAVVGGRSIFADGSAYDALQFSSVLSLPFLLEEFVPELAAAADGDPTTVVPAS